MKVRRITELAIACMFCLAVSCHSQSAGEAEKSTSQLANLMPNPSFEETDGVRPSSWQSQTWSGRAEFEYASIGRSGQRCVMISSQEGADADWYTTVAIRPYSRYRLSGWIKTENLVATSGKGALFNLHNIQPLQTPAVTGTKDWTRVELEFDSEANDSVQFNCLFGGWGWATGKAWYDDVRLELLSTKELNPTVTIDAGVTGAPISKYIYGQFIEHLGRCIYGGIWAEMLEDRKFYYPVNETFDPKAEPGNPYRIIRKSPWKIMGPKYNVKMVKKNSYVGEHTPVIDLPGGGIPVGIVQPKLALIKGKKYTGRIILAGDSAAAPIKLSLVWGEGKNDRDIVIIRKISSDFVKIPLSFKAGDSTDNGRLEIVGLGKGKFQVGTVSLMPADNIKGMRADTLKLLKELDSPIYRWPGGNFVSGYNWKDGIGDPDKRPPRKNPAWAGIEHNDFGIHEFIAFCKEINAEPTVTVNTGLGTVEETGKEVQYANGSVDTPMGKLRARNGAPKPFNVKWWCVGNEMFGGWQLGYMPLKDYVKKNNKVARTMWAVDPSIKLVAVGAVGEWDEQMLSKCADYMNLISEHFYRQENIGLMGHVWQIPSSVRNISNAHRDYRKNIPALAGKDIRIAMDEWNYWYGPEIYGQLGVRYHLKDALGIAAGLHEYFRNSDIIFMANYAQTVNVIGCIKTSKTKAEFATTGLALKLYRKHFGTTPVQVGGAPEPLDVVAAWTKDRKALTIGIVNPTEKQLELPVDFKGVALSGKGRLWQITGPDKMAYNEPGKPRQVDIVEKSVRRISNKFKVPPMSILLYKLRAK